MAKMINRDTNLAERLKTLKRENSGSQSFPLEKRLIDFLQSHVIYSGIDMNLSPVFATDYVESNEFGKKIGVLIDTQTEKIMWSFHKYPTAYSGYLLTDRNRDAFPVGQIFHYSFYVHEGPEFIIQPIFLTIHPDYGRRGFSKLMRFTLLYDQLLRQQNDACSDIFVIPFSKARETVYSFFKKLDHGLREPSHTEPKSQYYLDPNVVRRNLINVQNELGIEIVG